MGGKGGGGGGDSRTEIRYAGYLELAHKEFLRGEDGWMFNLKAAFRESWENNPYTGREDINIEDGLLGSGYEISAFPSLFDMFGKFMAGLDVETLWTQSYNQVTNGPEMDNIISTFNQETIDNFDEHSIPILNAGMRDIGSVGSSANIIGRALLENRRLKEVTKFSAQVRFQGLTLSQERWAKHLVWNQAVISQYSDMMKLYYAGAMDVDKLNYKYKSSEVLWELSLFNHAIAVMGALGGGTPVKDADDPSGLQSAIGGALSGAGAGAMIGSAIPGVGNVVGAAVGGIVGLASSFF